jgi:hypothetical protein
MQPFCATHVANADVEILDRELLGGERPLERRPAHRRWAGHLEVKAGLDGFDGGIRARPVAHDEPVEAPLLENETEGGD